MDFVHQAEDSADAEVIIPGSYNPWMPDDMAIIARWARLHPTTEVARDEQEWAVEIAGFQQ